MNVYDKCPSFENEDFLLRLVSQEDVEDLLKVYSDEKAVPFFNSDNCNGDDFHYTTMERMKQAIDFWIISYENKYFVRWSIIDKHTNAAIGTIELFHRDSTDFFNQCGLLRLDIRSDYEKASTIKNILTLIVPPAYNMFYCDIIATKVISKAKERYAAMTELEFERTEEKMVGGDDGRIYGDYMVLEQEDFCK